MSLKKIIKLFIPGLLLTITRSVRKLLEPQNKLFDGRDELFKKNISKSMVYGEYGCGKSTEFILDHFDVPVFSVDTSKFWVNKINKKINKNLYINHIDVGEVGDWGTPKSYRHRHNFENYTNWIWQQKQKPNVVLIDGRFRVCCFLTTLKFCDEGTRIIFDDYNEREYYHLVEEFLKPVSSNGRQSLFIVNDKSKFDLNKIDLEISKFMYVMN